GHPEVEWRTATVQHGRSGPIREPAQPQMSFSGLPQTGRPEFVAVEHCVKCDAVLSTQERFYRGGVCVYCGHISNSTICDTVKKAVQITKKPRRRRFIGIW